MKEFIMGTNPDSRLRMWWDGSEPIWVTMQKLKKNVYMYYWMGCEVDILGVRPTHCEEYVFSQSEKSFTDSIEKAVNVLSGRADMAAVYYDKLDVDGHHYGPLSTEVRMTVHRIDLAIQTLNQRIKDKNLQNDLNLILLSDHGITEIKWMDKVIELELYINMSDIIKMVDPGAVVSLWPKQAKFELIYRRLSVVGNMNVYKKQEIPDRYRYKNGKFVSPLTLVADPGWFITESKSKLPYWNNGTGEAQGWQQGWHGYDNEFVDMRGFFLAQGPDFKKNLRAGPIRVVDVYNLMCHTLGIQALPNNGSWSRVEYMLRRGVSGGDRPSTLFSCVLGLVLLLLSLQGLRGLWNLCQAQGNNYMNKYSRPPSSHQGKPTSSTSSHAPPHETRTSVIMKTSHIQVYRQNLLIQGSKTTALVTAGGRTACAWL
ncbi:hypothetical protein SKAU_G00038750 [Synaphobranchus kaupii]|uniref:glycerophosphocholine cholinephosphodiesterase n=1 Tax=Synaphobranchus kaupii TaxID=118154 RepID=A0A9Q1JHD7_SYNKA|nr:hypothetical protein SKAU_G00038750 [Synaphobranchus kaupii]